MKKEIGGYLELEEMSNESKHSFYIDAIALNSARNAFLYYAIINKIKKIYLPYFLCDSIAKVCLKNNIDIEYYHINKYLRPNTKIDVKENELFYLVNYYGQLKEEEIIKYKKQYRNIILDNVQCFFSKPCLIDVPTIYSCRKFFGVPDGGYLLLKIAKELDIGIDDSTERFKHLIGRKKENARNHYSEFLENEKLIDELPLLYMSKETSSILESIDYDHVISRRNNNFSYLSDRLNKFNRMNVVFNDGPFCYPFYCKNGNFIRQELVKKDIFVPILWPNVIESGSLLEKEMSINILPLPCDQRYSLEDMIFMCDIIEKYVKK